VAAISFLQLRGRRTADGLARRGFYGCRSSLSCLLRRRPLAALFVGADLQGRVQLRVRRLVERPIAAACVPGLARGEPAGDQLVEVQDAVVSRAIKLKNERRSPVLSPACGDAARNCSVREELGGG